MFERTLQALRHPRTHLGAAREQLAFQANRALWHAAELVGVTEVIGTDADRRFCARPFEHFEVKHDGNVYLCNAALVPLPVGNLRRSSPDEVWNSHTARSIRRAILDGTFAFCNKQDCWFLQRGRVPRAHAITEPRLREILDGRRDTLWQGPRVVTAGYDLSCNLACESCRRGLYAPAPAERARARQLQDAVVSWPCFAEVEQITVAGNGDPFGSPVYRDFLRSFDPERFPRLRFYLNTNGLLFTEAMWASMPGLAGRVDRVRVSIDAASSATYARIHGGADFATLLARMEFVARLRREGQIAQLAAHFCSQAANYRELPAFVALCRRLGFDRVVLSRLGNWGTYTSEDYAAAAVHRAAHPQHGEFLAVMAEPALRDPIVDTGNLTEFLPGQPARSRSRRRYSLTLEA
jgi:MoaA/NifB/PqqE/SkfB family radical SAM enzyme